MRQVVWALCLGLAAAGPAWAQADRMPEALPDGRPSGPLAPAEGCAGLPCDPFCCEPCGGSGWQTRVTADYLLWWVRKGPTPPLVTTGPVVTGDPLTSSGPIGENGTSVLFGESGLHYGTFSGGRWGLDAWLDSAGAGLQVNGFLLERRTVGFGAASDANGSPILARPFYDVLDNQPSAVLVTYPGALAGSVVATSSSLLWGAEGNLTALPLGDSARHGRLLLGFRYLDLLESLSVTHSSTVLPDGAAFLNGFQLNTGDNLIEADRFGTRNQFYGGQVGVEGEWELGRLVVGGTAKVALGGMHEVVQVQGSTVLLSPGVSGIVDSAPAGVLAQDTNSGRTRKNVFAAVPELNVKVSYHLTDNLLASVGYTFLYASDVVRPGSQIDTGINVGRVPSSEVFGLFPTPLRPEPLFNHSDFWAQGISLGLELRF